MKIDDLKSFDENLSSRIPKKDILILEDTIQNELKIMPNSTSFVEGHTNFGEPFYIQTNDKEYDESVGMSLTLEQAIKMRDFLDSKIKIIKSSL